MNTNEILLSLRKSKKISQKTLADLLGVSIPAYQNYEYGKSELNYEGLRKLADFYEVSTDYLLGRTTVKQTATEQPDPLANIDISAVEKRIIERYTALDEDMRAMSIELFKQLSTVFDDAQPKQRHIIRSEDIEDACKQEEATQPVTSQSNIQVSKRAIARSKGNPFREAPTPEQIASFTPVPEDSDL